MPRQLDILALEPFFGGARRHMLETLVRFSRHRWTLLKLPPRRMERRLTAAANWFSELLTRHWVGHVDLLFTSEAMNLSHLLRLMPELARHPSVVYFHDNQLPEPSDSCRYTDRPLDLVNLGTAQAATRDLVQLDVPPADLHDPGRGPDRAAPGADEPRPHAGVDSAKPG